MDMVVIIVLTASCFFSVAVNEYRSSVERAQTDGGLCGELGFDPEDLGVDAQIRRYWEQRWCMFFNWAGCSSGLSGK
ncbi:unnamed protein product, partial [Ectocarpus sp. 13 AM-2016]